MKRKESNQSSFFNLLDDKRGEKANDLHLLFRDLGVNFATGVPCGVLRNIIANLINDQRVFHVPVNRESEAVGFAAGAYLAGKTPLVYMQNSGLFASSNDIASLLIPYKIPVFFVVTYRGCEGEDAIQHLVTGGATENLLNSFNLPYEVYENQDLNVLIRQMFLKMSSTSLPIVLLLKRGWEL